MNITVPDVVVYLLVTSAVGLAIIGVFVLRELWHDRRRR